MHPDLFAQYPEQQEVNDRSMKSLQGFLDGAGNLDEGYPPAALLRLPFYTRSDEEGQFGEVMLVMETNGGDCASVIEQDLGLYSLTLNGGH